MTQDQRDKNLASIEQMLAAMAGLDAPGTDSDTPSAFTLSFWIYAVSKTYSDEDRENINQERIGKWCIFVDKTQIDEQWKTIKAAVENGKLWHFAKCSSALLAADHGGSHLICVYTSDYKNKDDVMNIRAVLRDIGVTEQLKYKRDIDTRDPSKTGTDREFYYAA